MDTNKWEDQLRDLLGDYKPGDTSSPLKHEEVPTAEEPVGLPDPLTSNKEETVKILQEQAWKRIEASLDANDQAFDETLKRKISHYGPQYDPQSWPVFIQRFADSRFLRSKLILLKTIEVSALILLLITAVNMGRLGKFDFNSNRTNTETQENLKAKINQHGAIQDAQPNAENYGSGDGHLFTSHDTPKTKPGNTSILYGPDKDARSTVESKSTLEFETQSTGELSFALAFGVAPSTPAKTEGVSDVYQQTPGHTLTAGLPLISVQSLDPLHTKNAIPDLRAKHSLYSVEPLDMLASAIEDVDLALVPHPVFVKTKHRKFTEFGMLIQSDYNGLRMPEDRLYTSGQQIVFPQQGIMSHGFGGGFTIAIGHSLWALETGIIYSAKDFKPGRQLIVGGVFDNGSVDFEAMRLQLVSIPVQYRYRFDHTGRLRMYGLGGVGFNVIAESNIDVQVKYHFPSLSFGQDPNSNPDLLETIEETRHISEHFRDGAPLSTKTFVSVNGGIGVEYQITEYKTLFLQTTIQYQIPNLKFSNNNGKHLRSASLQAGVRTPLGK